MKSINKIITGKEKDFERMKKDADNKGMSLSAYIRFATAEYERMRKNLKD